MIKEMLPGKVAGIVQLDTKGDALIEVPDEIIARRRNLGIPPFPLSVNTCIASGREDISPGDKFYAMPLDGLWINPNDPDIPELGAIPKKGEQLRLYREDAVFAVDK